MKPPPAPSPNRTTAGKIWRFAVVGLSGVLVNQGLLMVLHGGLRWPLLLSSAIAIELSILNNFVWNAIWTWHYDFRQSARQWFTRCLRYHGSTVLAAAIGNVVVLMALVSWLGMDYRLANLIGIAVGSAINYLLSDRWVFRD